MSRRASVVVVTCFALALAAVAGAQGAARDYPTIDVTFNSNNTISATLNGVPLGTTGGAPTAIPPGTYNMAFTNPTYVSDIQFHLEGPGVKLITNMSYGEEPSEIWVETFAPSSTYTWKDDLNPTPVFTFVTSTSASVGSANSGSSGASNGKSSTPISSGTNGKASSTDVVGSAIAPFRGTLTAGVSATGVVTLKLGGKPVQNLKTGKYTFAISDASKSAGFNLQLIKNSPLVLTTGAFTGKKKKTLVLRAGQWFYYPTFVGKKTYFIVTS
jgi:hypothetical protein